MKGKAVNSRNIQVALINKMFPSTVGATVFADISDSRIPLFKRPGFRGMIKRNLVSQIHIFVLA